MGSEPASQKIDVVHMSMYVGVPLLVPAPSGSPTSHVIFSLSLWKVPRGSHSASPHMNWALLIACYIDWPHSRGTQAGPLFSVASILPSLCAGLGGMIPQVPS